MGAAYLSAEMSSGNSSVPAFRTIKKKSKPFNYKKLLATLVMGDPKAPFSIANTPRCRGGLYSFSWIVPFYPNLITMAASSTIF